MGRLHADAVNLTQLSHIWNQCVLANSTLELNMAVILSSCWAKWWSRLQKLPMLNIYNTWFITFYNLIQCIWLLKQWNCSSMPQMIFDLFASADRLSAMHRWSLQQNCTKVNKMNDTYDNSEDWKLVVQEATLCLLDLICILRCQADFWLCQYFITKPNRARLR